MKKEEKIQLGVEVRKFLTNKGVAKKDMRKVLSALYYKLSDELKEEEPEEVEEKKGESENEDNDE